MSYELGIIGKCSVCGMYLFGNVDYPEDDVECPDPECSSHGNVT